MKIELTPQQRDAQQAFRSFVQEEVAPYANQFDIQEYTPPEIIQKMAMQGYLGMLISTEYGGIAADMITYGLLNEEIGKGCSSLRSLITVHSMISYAIQRWGSRQQKETWLSRLATGEIIGAFGLSEPNVGSDAKNVETSATPTEGGYILRGQKRWTTYGQIANLYLIFVQCQGKVSAFLVERETPGFSIEPLFGMLGTKASMMANLHFQECFVARENLIGGMGFGLASVATSALDIGRYTVAWGCVGIAQACLEASLQYAQERKQFGRPLKDHQLIQHMLSDMITQTKAARLLCLQAGYLKDVGHPNTVMETWIAKYFASTTANRIANDAVQIHGANGCSSAYSVQRYLRDAKIMEIIEGSTQIQQITIAQHGEQLLYSY